MIAPAPHAGLPTPVRRRSLALLVGALLGALLAVPAIARADDSSTLTIVGTSDVQDSRLMPDLIEPAFKEAFPQFTVKYVSLGTGAAITQAEQGNASMLLVHAPSLENQFVGQGFSKEKFGRAIFWGDYVLLGANSDPAGVGANGAHDVVQAFEDVAAAGAAGHADFVSRANTSGTAVQEHQIWALAAGTPGLTLCTVSQANGGGAQPSTVSGPCPSTPSPPPWYHGTGLTQAPNVEAANTCNFPNASGGAHPDCYVFTDRGTFDCLTDAKCSSESASARPTSLKIVTRDNGATAKGGNTVLVNTFHIYELNPAKFSGNPSVQINTVAAQDFLSFITSPGLQSQLKNYLGATHDPPFIADASPLLTASRLPGRPSAAKLITVRGKLTNVVPGTPALHGVRVTIEELGGGPAGVPLASARTNGSGAYKLRFRPTSTGRYQLFTGAITKIENSALNPVFGDLLQPAATASSKITVRSAIASLHVRGAPGRIVATGLVFPNLQHVKGTVTLVARRGRKGAFRKIASERLATDDAKFALSATRPAGRWSVRVRFQDGRQVIAATSASRTVTVSASSSASAAIRSLKIRRGRATVSGSARRPTSGQVELLALDLGPIAKGNRAPNPGSAGSSARLRVVAKSSAHGGRFTLHARLKRGQHWALQLQYLPAGSAVAVGAIRTARVG